MPKQITQDQIVSDFQLMYKYHVPYTWSGHEWHVDKDGNVVGSVGCAGAFVWAYEQHGLKIYNGSNRIARVYVKQLIPIREATLKPGMAAFKMRKPGEKDYDLPDTYKKGGAHYNGDLNDYYHIGLLDTDVNYVLNAQSKKTGFVRSKLMKDTWEFVGELNDVGYHEGSGGKLTEMKVVAEKGNTVNLRKSASTTSTIITAIPIGSIVQAAPESNGWRYVTYQTYEGYMMSKFLEEVHDGSTVSIVLPRDMAIELLKALQKALGN